MRGGALGALFLAVLAAFAAALVSRDQSEAARCVIPAIESDQAAALAAQGNIALSDFWARAKAMGVSAAIMRPQSLDEAIRRGEILRFDRDEVERWKAAGLLNPSSTLKPDTFWTKDERLFGQLLQAVTRQGITATTSTLAGFKVLQVPEGGAPLELRGYDPDRVAALGGLAPVYVEPAGFPGRVDLGEFELEPVTWRLGGPHASLLRNALGRPRRLLVLTLDPALGLDGNFAKAREALHALEGAGASLTLPAKSPAPAPGPALLSLALAAAWLAGILGPLFAARGGLLVLRRSRRYVMEKSPHVSPVGQMAAGLLSTAAFAMAAGLVVHALGALSGHPLPRNWAATTLVAPLVIAVLTLYTIDPAEWAVHLKKPVTYGGLLAIVAGVFACAALLAPRWLLHRLGLWSPLHAAAAHIPGAWWWAWRWREMLVGVPMLVQALFLINWRLECPDCASLPAKPINDPRHFFLLGLLAPIGIMTAVGQGGAPETAALLHTVWTLIVGSVIGAAFIALRLRAAHTHEKSSHSHAHPKGPIHA